MEQLNRSSGNRGRSLPNDSISLTFMPQRLEDNVRGAYERAIEGIGSRDELLSAVRILVRDLKREGQPPEKVIITVKQVCGLPMITFAADTDANADRSQAKQIADMMVRAAIDEYYQGPLPSDATAGSLTSTR
jgi:hypothetical protein